MQFSIKGLSSSIQKFLTGGVGGSSALWSWTVPGEWQKRDLIKQYTRVVYTVISAIAEDAAKIEFELKNGDTVIKDHEFLTLMKKPNPDHSQFQFLEDHFTFMEIFGESFWYIARGAKTRRPKELYLVRPDCIEVVIDDKSETGIVAGYVLSKADGTKVPFEPNEILHFKMPNPQNPYRGLGPVEAAKMYIQTEEFSTIWTRNALFNSGRPSGVLNFGGTVDRDHFNQIKKQFKEMYSGVENAGKTLITRSADKIDFTKIGMELQELALKELKDMNRDDIMMMFRVSKTMLGISEGVTLNNARESREMFRESITHSKWDRLNDHLAAFLIPEWQPKSASNVMAPMKLTLGYKNTVYRTIEQELADDVAAVDKWATKNEIREKRGLKPLPGGDVIYQGINLVPMLEESADPPEERPAIDNSGSNDQPKEDPNNPGMDMDGNPMPDSKKSFEESVKKKDLRAQQAEIFKTVFFQTQEAWERKYLKFMVGEFRKQQKEILAKNTKANFQNWMFDVDASNARIVGNLVPMSNELMKQAGKLALEMANDGETEFSINQKIKEYIFDRIKRLAIATNDETIAAIDATIAEGVAVGDSLDKLRKRIQNVYSEATTVRAERIARTESLAASNEGALEAYKQSPLVTAKEWSSEADACEFCMAFDGTVVGLNEDFAFQGQGVEGEDGGKLRTNYEDIEHPPLHPNCRCALLPVAG